LRSAGRFRFPRATITKDKPMSQTFEFYDSRAREAATEAKEAVLDNVRERSLRAEKTWRGLAEQARKVKIDRERALNEREAKRLAEEAAVQSSPAPEAA
jgi:hypothetical protein